MTETIREKIKSRLDELEENLKCRKHLLEHASEDEVVEVLDKFYKKYDLSPNF